MSLRPRDIGWWIVTAVDDLVIEKFWYRLSRGAVADAIRVWTELAAGFWRLALVAALVTVSLIVLDEVL